GLAHRGNRCLRLLLNSARALGLELELVPKRREFLNHLVEPDLPRLGPAVAQLITQAIGLRINLPEPIAKPGQDLVHFGVLGHDVSASLRRTDSGYRLPRTRARRSAAIRSSESVVATSTICALSRWTGLRRSSYAARITANRSGARSGGNSR